MSRWRGSEIIPSHFHVGVTNFPSPLGDTQNHSKYLHRRQHPYGQVDILVSTNQSEPNEDDTSMYNGPSRLGIKESFRAARFWTIETLRNRRRNEYLAPTQPQKACVGGVA